MRLEEFSEYTAGCFNGEPASCSYACPFFLDIRGFAQKMEKGRWQAALKAYRESVYFPLLVSRLCSAPCRDYCQCTGDSVDMPKLEGACVELAKSRKPDIYVLPSKTASIAVVGAGAAGLACALNLSRKRYRVTVYEREPGWGGALRSHPEFREYDAEFKTMFDPLDAKFLYGSTIADTCEVSGYDAVFVTAPNVKVPGVPLADTGHVPGSTVFTLPVCGREMETVELIALGARVGNMIESFLQTGRAEFARGPDRSLCTRFVPSDGALPSRAVKPLDGVKYTESEAKLEAARCRKCDCTACIDACPMLKKYKKTPKRIALEAFTDTQVSPPMSTHTLTREVYSCNSCSNCKNVCPSGVDVGAVLLRSRELRRLDKHYPEALHEFWLREMDYNTQDAGYSRAPESGGRYLFFPGCQLPSTMPRHTVMAYNMVRRQHGAGIFGTCCGAPAYWAGDHARFDENRAQILKVWETYDKSVFVFACATCRKLFSEFMPEISGISLYELISPGAVSKWPKFESASVFDPCSAVEYDSMSTAVHELAKAADVTLTVPLEKNRCCGYGGQMQTANPVLFETIAQARSELSEKPYIVYCANCREVFASRSKKCAHILELVFNEPCGGKVKIDDRRENAFEVKRMITDAKKETKVWDTIEVEVSAELREKIDARLISVSELKEAIYESVTTGRYFEDEHTGVRQCRLTKPVVTYWVVYLPLESGVYRVTDAFSHRMRIGEKV